MPLTGMLAEIFSNLQVLREEMPVWGMREDKTSEQINTVYIFLDISIRSRDMRENLK